MPRRDKEQFTTMEIKKTTRDHVKKLMHKWEMDSYDAVISRLINTSKEI